jgi:uncharacterized protein involved in oxidation of intracellular sulfur
MKLLLIFNRNPYDGTDITWNGLRLASQLLKSGSEVWIFLMNDAVDLARDTTKPPADYFDLVQILKDLIAQGVPVKVCGTCKARCGIHKGQPYFQGSEEAKMSDLAQWVIQADKVITF